MQNFGGPGRIGKDLATYIQSKGGEFYWFHNSEKVSPSFECVNNINIDSVLTGNFDIIFYNQWRTKTIFEHFNGLSNQILFLMYEEIPKYWEDFTTTKNRIVSSSNSINNCLGINADVISWAFPPLKEKEIKSNKLPTLFYPVRNGGEKDRKGVMQFSKSLQYIHSNFSIIMLLEKSVHDFYKQNAPEIFTDERLLIIENELSDEQYINLFSQCDALLSTSKTSGIELALREGVAFYKDIIVPNIRPFNEVFNAKNAWLIDAENVDNTSFEDNIIEISIFQAKPEGIADAINDYCHNFKLNIKKKVEPSHFYELFLNNLNTLLCL